MGTSTGDIGLFKIRRVDLNSEFRIPHSEIILDGSRNNNCWGTYLHGSSITMLSDGMSLTTSVSVKGWGRSRAA